MSHMNICLLVSRVLFRFDGDFKMQETKLRIQKESEEKKKRTAVTYLSNFILTNFNRKLVNGEFKCIVLCYAYLCYHIFLLLFIKQKLEANIHRKFLAMRPFQQKIFKFNLSSEIFDFQ